MLEPSHDLTDRHMLHLSVCKKAARHTLTGFAILATQLKNPIKYSINIRAIRLREKNESV